MKGENLIKFIRGGFKFKLDLEETRQSCEW